ncbi:MAG: hypothetical protein CMH56_02065 [Myxococcales bacterium]|nr:hypothetical protein [Myxococcales bacterium]
MVPNDTPPKKDRETWLVSACLLGQNCRYNAEILAEIPDELLPVLNDKNVVPICPESEGGLPTPRPAAQIAGPSGEAVLDGQSHVTTHEGADVTPAFLKGAALAVNAAANHGATKACLKARSPSCGVGLTHTKSGLAQANGVTAAALHRAGLQLFTEEDLMGRIDETGPKGH